jgi:hypothetical protein
MTYLHEKRNMEWQRTECMLAAAQGQLPCLHYAHEHGCNLKGEGYRSGFWWDVACTSMQAFRSGHVECLHYAHENGCQLVRRLYTSDCEHTSTARLHYIRDRPDAFESVIAVLLHTIGRAATRLGSISCVNKARALG